MARLLSLASLAVVRGSFRFRVRTTSAHNKVVSILSAKRFADMPVIALHSVPA